jgi:hypothetical protein
MLQGRIQKGILEDCYRPYRNPWFLVKKNLSLSKGSSRELYRLINLATKVNRVIIKDAYIPPNIEEFLNNFTGLVCVSVLDIHSRYDQVELAKESRNLTRFQTPIGLLRITTLP